MKQGMIWEQRPHLVNQPFPGLAGMQVIDLPTRGKLSALVFEVLWFNNAGGDNTLNPLDMMTLIEVVHRGSEVVKSLTGIQHAGIAWRRGENRPFQLNFGNANMWQDAAIVIPFGREPYDREYGLTLDNLVNPQLRITWNNAYAASGDGAGGFLGAVGNFSTRLIYAPDDVMFKGYIKTSRIDQYQLVAGQMFMTEMPKNYKWPRIYIYEDCATMGMMFNLNTIELQVDNRSWVPLQMDQYSMQRLDESEFGSPILCRFHDNLNATAPLPIYSVFDMCWKSWTQSNQAVAMELRLQQGIFDPTMDFINTAATDAGKIWETGHGFGRMYALPFVPPKQEHPFTNLFDSREFGRTVLEVTANPAIGVTPQVTIILEELIEGM